MTLPDWSAQDFAIAQPVLDAWIATYGLDPALAYGLVSQESRFKPAAFLLDRNGGSYGLTQLSLPTAQGMGYTGDGQGLFNPDVNVQYGLLYLANLLQQYGGVWDEALSAYNCGYPTGCAAGDVYAAAVEDRAAYFADLFAPPAGAGGSFGDAPSPSLGILAALAVLGLGAAWLARQS